MCCMAEFAVSVEKPVCSMGKGTSWVNKEVKMLLSIWVETNIQEELDGAVRNKNIHERNAKRLLKAGFDKDWVQCRVKIKNLKACSLQEGKR